jgi:hypothetical protein
MKKRVVYLLLSFVLLLASCAPLSITPESQNTAIATTTSQSPTVNISATSETLVDEVNLSELVVNEWASTSPDGNWVAVGLVAFPGLNSTSQLAYVRLIIFNTKENARWTIIDHWKKIGLGFPMPQPLKWSQDKSHFYFTHSVTPDGCSMFENFNDLHKVNLDDGTVIELLPPSGLGLALSPDESKVAYLGYGDRGLVIRNLITGEEQESKLDPGKDFYAGNILWSPDGNSLALTLAINPCTGEFVDSKTVYAESTTILLVDPVTFEQRVLVEENPQLFITYEWKEPEHIIITDGLENSIWRLVVDTGEIVR